MSIKQAIEALEGVIRVADRATVEFDNARAALAALRSMPTEPVARVADVYMSRYTLEWFNGPLPEGTKLYAAPVTLVAQGKHIKPSNAWAHADLMTFYGVTDLTALVEAQAHHIEKLQAKLPRNDQPAFTRVREG